MEERTSKGTTPELPTWYPAVIFARSDAVKLHRADGVSCGAIVMVWPFLRMNAKLSLINKGYLVYFTSMGPGMYSQF